MKGGIAGAGNWIIDQVKTIDVYPEQDALANILSESSSNGGAPYNVLKALSKLGFVGNLVGIGRIGNDPEGQAILIDCQERKIDTSQLRFSGEPTSHTDVMAVQSTGRRTFFHRRGANAEFDLEDVDFEALSACHLHLGYLLLLDALDQPDLDYGTRAAALLARAQIRGLTTSFDVVSEASNRFPQIVRPALAHADIAFMNEFELARVCGSTDELEVRELVDYGNNLAKEMPGWLVVHTPEWAFAFKQGIKPIRQGSVLLPRSSIVGTVGAGDAFAAGVLAGFTDGFGMDDCLRFGCCVAASSLLAADCSSGILSWKECLNLGMKHGYRE